jgi:hypothetical protein
MGSLNSIVKLPSSDLGTDRLFIMIEKLGRTATLAIFLVCMNFFLDSTNGRFLYTSFRLDLMQGIAFMKKRDDSRALGRRYRMHMVVERKEDG